MVGAELDLRTLRAVLEDHPVRLAVLFGSVARGTPSVESDVDIAVAFDETVADTDRIDARVSLIVDLMRALQTDAIDVADLDTIRASVGAHAIQSGQLLVGDEQVLDTYRRQFADKTANRAETHDERLRRLDAIVDRLEARL